MAYHLQTNGLTEHLNKTVTDMPSVYVSIDRKDWDDILPYITFAYSTTIQESTGFTPFHLLHSREVTTMLNAMLLPDNLGTFYTDTATFAQRADDVYELT